MRQYLRGKESSITCSYYMQYDFKGNTLFFLNLGCYYMSTLHYKYLGSELYMENFIIFLKGYKSI